MKQWQVLRTVFPEVITDNFEFTDYIEQADRLEYWLDEREYKRTKYYCHGGKRHRKIGQKGKRRH